MKYLRWSIIATICVLAIGIGYKIVDNYYGRLIAVEVHRVMQAANTVINKLQEESKASTTPTIQVEKSLPPPLLGGAPAPTATLELPGVRVQLSPEDGWQTVAMLLSTVLGTLLGIKLINRLFEK